LKPGWHIWWPFISALELIPTARQTLNLPIQSLMTKDGKQVAVGGIVIYKINNVVRAIGELNYDVDETVQDISQTAIVEVITSWDFEALLKELNGEVPEALTGACRKQLRCFGVYVNRVALSDFSQCHSINLLGVNLSITPE